MRILDYSAGYPGARAVRDAGYGGVIRYLRKEGNSVVRPITPVEYQDMRAYGLDVAFVYQHVSKSRVTQGYAAGQHDAVWAMSQVAIATGDRNNARAIYFAVDYDAPAGDFPAIAAYMRGVANMIGQERTGTYGKWALLNYLFSETIIAYGWQTYAWSPGHNKDPSTFHPKATLFQQLGSVVVGGIACDVNEVLDADYGQTPAPTPIPQPIAATQEEDEVSKFYYVKGDGKAAMPAPHESTKAGDLVFLVEANAEKLTRRHIHPDELKAASVTPVTVTHAWLDKIPGADGDPVELWPWENAGGGPVPGEPAK